MTLNDMQHRVLEVNQANGWFDDERAFGDDVALLHSEVSEMFEAYRDHGFEDRTRILCAHKRFGADYDAHDESQRAGEHLCKPEGFGSEAADVLVRLLDTNHRHGSIWFSLATLDGVKPHSGFSMQSTVGEHIANLHMFIVSLGTHSTREVVTIGLSEVLSYLVAWTNHLEIDLEAEFERKLAYNATRGHKHGGKLL